MDRPLQGRRGFGHSQERAALLVRAAAWLLLWLPACLLPASLATRHWLGLLPCLCATLAHRPGMPAPSLPCPSLPCRCDAKDQMIHLFAMPPTWDPYTPAAQAKARRAGEGSTAEL